MKKSIILILPLVIGLGSLSAVHGIGNGSEPDNKSGIVYKDVSSTNWAYESINEMTSRKIVNGFPDGSFKPGNTVTYAEFIKMALMADGRKDVGNAALPNHWAKNYYDAAVDLNYFSPYQVHESQLDNQIPRGDMALIISSILGDVTIKNYDAIQDGIKDITAETKYEYDITKAYATGILTGYTDKTFRPDQSLSRAEAAMVIYRLVDESKRQLPVKSKEAGTKVDVKVGNQTYSVTSHDVELGYNGVEKIQVNSLGRIVIYSTVCYDAISLYIDNVQVSPIGFTSGLNFYKENKYFIYLANPVKQNINIKGKTPSLMFDDVQNIYRYSNVTL